MGNTKLFLGFGLNSVNPKFWNDWEGWLNACVFDARDIGALARSAGYSARAAFNEDCTIENIRSEFKDANAKLVDGDEFWFHYSGHGLRRGSWNGGYNEGLCLYDGEFMDSALIELAAGFAPGVRFIITLDSCHAGGMNRNSTAGYSAKFAKRSSVVNVSVPRVKPQASGIILAACRADEVAMDGEFNGAFTGALIDTKAKHAQYLTWESWIHEVKLYCDKFVPAQHPLLERVGADADWNVAIANG